jgi:hypothetical protein
MRSRHGYLISRKPALGSALIYCSTVPAGFISAIKTAATSPLGLVALIGLAVVWVCVELAQYRLRHISKIIQAVPERDRPGLLAREYSTFPRSALSPEQWIRSRKNQNSFYTALALIVAITVIGVAAMWVPRSAQRIPGSPASKSGNASTTGPESPAVTGTGNSVSVEKSDDANEKSPPAKKRNP